jgi:GTPase SAR1 family protein
MDNWRVAVLGDGGVGKTALAVQVSISKLLFLLDLKTLIRQSSH